MCDKVGWKKKKKLIHMDVPWCPSNFSPDNLPPISISGLLRGGRTGKKGSALSSTAPISPCYALAKCQARCLGSDLGAHLHWVVGQSACACVSSEPFYLFYSIFSFYTNLKIKWVLNPAPPMLIPHGMGEHGIGRIVSQHWSSELSSKLCSLHCSF